MKVLRAKKNAKIKKNQSESGENLQMNSEKQRRTGSEAGVSAVGKNNQVIFSNPRFPIEASVYLALQNPRQSI